MRMFALLASASLATQAPTLDPGSDWHWDDAATGCALIQQGSSSRNMLEISHYPGSDEVWLTLADSRLKTSGYEPLEDVALALEPGALHTGDGRLHPETDKSAAEIGVGITDPTFLREFATASNVVVSHHSVGSLRRSVHSAAAAVQALSQCEAQRLRSWGIDPDYWQALRKRPRPLQPLGRLFSSDDYPPGYVLNGVNGEVLVRLTVDTDGRVKGCVGLNRRVDRYFLQNICRKLKIIARFEPAVDAQGHTVEAPFITGATFQVER